MFNGLNTNTQKHNQHKF